MPPSGGALASLWNKTPRIGTAPAASLTTAQADTIVIDLEPSGADALAAEVPVLRQEEQLQPAAQPAQVQSSAQSSLDGT